jgi:hypothetical protein
VKGALEKLQIAILNIQAYLAKRGDLMDPLASKSSISPIDPTPVQSLSLSADTLEHINTIKHEVSGTSSACPTEMGEGEMGLPNAPFLRWWDCPKKIHRHSILTMIKI